MSLNEEDLWEFERSLNNVKIENALCTFRRNTEIVGLNLEFYRCLAMFLSVAHYRKHFCEKHSLNLGN